MSKLNLFGMSSLHLPLVFAVTVRATGSGSIYGYSWYYDTQYNVAGQIKEKKNTRYTVSVEYCSVVRVSYFACSRTIKHHLPLNTFPQCKEMGYRLNVNVSYVIYDIQFSILNVTFPQYGFCHFR